jgi:hypothetical protein
MAPDAPAAAISVVMATLNGARFVAEQLDSIAAQTLRPAELLVGDEGSTDRTLEIVERFVATAPFPVTLIRNPRRLGAAENFLALATRARGPIVALSDWDDVWDPRKLERIAPWFGDPAVGLVVHRSRVVDESLRPLGPRYPAFRRTVIRPPRRVDPWLSVPGMGMVLRRDLLGAVAAHAADRPREAGGHAMDHDDWIYLLSGSLGKTVLLAEDLALYRQHGASYMGAPGGRVQERLERGLSLGSEHFLREAAMFRARRAFWHTIAADPATAESVREQATRAAAWSGHLASLQATRAGVRADTAGRIRRLARLARLAATGGYRARTRAGLGARALAADIASLIRRRSAASVALPEGLAGRVAAERAAGRSAEAIIAELTRESLSPPYGRRWTPEMIRDLVFEARRGAEPDSPVTTGALGASLPGSSPSSSATER